MGAILYMQGDGLLLLLKLISGVLSLNITNHLQSTVSVNFVQCGDILRSAISRTMLPQTVGPHRIA